MQEARALQQSEAFAGYRQRRVVVEHRLARLVQLGIRQARYFGRAKTKFQLYLAATVANLTLVAAKAGLRAILVTLPAETVPPAPAPAVLQPFLAQSGSVRFGRWRC